MKIFVFRNPFKANVKFVYRSRSTGGCQCRIYKFLNFMVLTQKSFFHTFPYVLNGFMNPMSGMGAIIWQYLCALKRTNCKFIVHYQGKSSVVNQKFLHINFTRVEGNMFS